MSEEIKKLGPQAIDRYEDLSQIVRLLIGCMAKLEKATKQSTRLYWTQSVNHWIKQAKACLDNTQHFETPLTKHLAQELTSHIELLKKLKAPEIKDLPIIADDLLYRVSAMIGSMTTVKAVRMSLVELEYIKLKETIATRLNELTADYDITLSDGAPTDQRQTLLARIDELENLFPKPKQDGAGL